MPLEPSLGYHSLEEELHEIEQKLDVFSNNLIKNKPIFIFDCLNCLDQNKHLVFELEKTQRDIQKSLSSSDFFEIFLCF